jgi:hypothetical protein
MRTLILAIAAGAAATIGFHGAKWETWYPQESARWNMFALRESGLGRMASRAMTKDADVSWHHGLTVPKQARTSNALARWIDQGAVSLGFQGRLIYRPPSKYPIRPSEVVEVLAKTEKDLSTAFKLDPGNYEAYDAYMMFLTTQIRETEFGSMDGQKEDDDASSVKADDKKDAGDAGGDDDDDFAAVQRFRKWEKEEQRRRNLRAVAITDYAISRFAPKETDPERHLGLAMVYYNRFALLAPDVPSRRSSFIAGQLFETQALQTAEKMEKCLQNAQSRQQSMIVSGVWQNRSEARLSDYQQDEQMVEKYISVLYESVISNRKLDGANPAPQMVSSAPVPRSGGINKPPSSGTYLVPTKPSKASLA